MKILVFGAGVIGCNLAQNFYHADRDVTLLVRGDWGKQIEGNGLQIRGIIRSELKKAKSK